MKEDTKPAAAAAEKEEAAKPEVLVTCVVPRAFILRDDKHREIKIEAGVQELPDWVPEHWYSKANGVKVYDPRKNGPKPEPAKSGAVLKAEQLEAQMGELADGKVKDVIEALPALADDELAALLALETAGKNRVSLVDAIKAEQASDTRTKK
jgi:hypothetical protein